VQVEAITGWMNADVNVKDRRAVSVAVERRHVLGVVVCPSRFDECHKTVLWAEAVTPPGPLGNRSREQPRKFP
jgi:hypothetical protein